MKSLTFGSPLNTSSVSPNHSFKASRHPGDIPLVNRSAHAISHEEMPESPREEPKARNLHTVGHEGWGRSIAFELRSKSGRIRRKVAIGMLPRPTLLSESRQSFAGYDLW
eukprot:1394265-Amorphochlora_amoeboformis.AAC.2